MNNNLETTDLISLVKMVVDKKISSKEITQHYLENIKKSDQNAFITLDEEKILTASEEADKNIARGDFHQLSGIPIGIKDLFCTSGIRTTAASKMLDNFIPTYESDVTAKILQAGGFTLGKLNMDEFAMGSTNTNSYFGPCISKWKMASAPEKKLIPGGSSGGSACAVSSNLAIAALGSDTGGSVRQPAALCGLVGAKPSYGICSRFGMIGFASSLDQPGVLTKTVHDAAYLIEVISGATNNDSMMYNKSSYNFTQTINNGVSGIKIGIPKEFQSDGIIPEIRNAWDLAAKNLQSMGAIIKEVSLPLVNKAINIYYIIAPAEAASNLARYNGVRYGYSNKQASQTIDDFFVSCRTEGFGKEVKRRIMIGNFVLSSSAYEDQYMKAMKIRRMIKYQFDEVFQDVDAILSPTTTNCAYPIDEQPDDPVQTYLNDIFTVPVNIAGLPAISVPYGFSNERLPIGMQVITNHLNDSLMYQIARSLEKSVSS